MEYKEKLNEDESAITPASGRRLCEICRTNESSYTCPKCNIAYCNLNCYRNAEKHLKCSENFYHDQVVEELKQISLENDVESRNKMARILLKESKQYENDDIESQEEEAQQPNEDEMLKLYEDEINKWRPWWKSNESLKEPLLEEIEKTSNRTNRKHTFNLTLIKNSTNINTSNANEFILNDILQMTYHYIIIANIYQLNENDFTRHSKESDPNLIKELVDNFIQLQNLANNSSSTRDLKQKFDLIVRVLNEETRYFLKSYINRQFLVSMLDEIIYLVGWPELILHCVSKIYSILETYVKLITTSKKRLDNDLNDKLDSGQIELDFSEEHPPLNVFYLNREVVKQQAQNTTNKTKRVEIVTKNKKPSSTLNPSFDSENYGKKEAKLFMKKCEFFFKWLSDNKQKLKTSISSKQNLTGQLEQVKRQIENETKELNEEKKLFDRNLNHLRLSVLNENNKKGQTLIEELN